MRRSTNYYGVGELLGGAVVLVILYSTSRYNYLVFHSLAELFSIAVACGMFLITWNARRQMKNNYLLLLGIAYMFVSVIDLVHTLAYKGMGVFPNYDANLPTQLWIAARYMQSLSLLAAPLLFGRKVKMKSVLIGYTTATALLIAAAFGRVFPDCYIEGAGLTPFKIASEYVISALLVVAAILLWRERARFDARVFGWLAGSVILTIFSELAFTFYVGVYDFSNLVGHFFKIAAFYLVYKAIIETGLTRPYDLLFRDLRQSHDALRESEARLTAILDNTLQSFVLIDREHHIQAFNRGAAQQALAVFGIEMRRGASMYDFVLPRDMKNFTANFAQALDGELIERELEFRGADGQDHWFHFSYNPVFANGGEVSGVCFNTSDITDRKRAEEKLRESEEAFRQFFDNVREVIALENVVDGSIIYISPSYERVFGQKVETLLRNPAAFLETIHPDDRERVLEIFERETGAEPAGGGYQTEYRVVHPDGKVRCISSSGFPILDADGVVYRYAVITEDITERKHAEEALRKSEARYRAVSEMMSDYVYALRVTPEGFPGLEWMTDGFRRITGYDHAEVSLVDSLERVIHPDDRALVQQHLQKCLANQVDIVEARVITKSGEERWVRDHLRPVWDEAQNRVVRIYGAAQDITKRKRAEEELRRYEVIISNISDPISYVDRNYIYCAVNEAYAQYAKMPRAEIVGRSVAEILGQETFEKQVKPRLDRCFAGEEIHYQEWFEVFGEPARFMDVSYYPVHDEKGAVVGAAVSSRDATDRKRAEIVLEKYKQIVSSTQDGISLVDQDYRYEIVNEAYERFSGMSREQLIGLTVAEYLSEEFFNDYVRDNFERCLAGEIIQYQAWVEYKTLGKRFVDVTYAPYIAANGEINGVVASTRDITELKLAEEKLRESEERLRDLAANFPGAVYQFQLNQDGSCSVPYMSAGGEQLFERPLAEVLDPAVMFDDIHPDDYEAFQSSIALSAQSMETWTHEFRIVPQPGRVKWLRGSSNPRKQTDGSVIWHGVLVDITARVRAEEALIKQTRALEESQAELTAIIESSPFTMMVVDREWRIQKIEDESREFVKDPAQELLGLRCGEALCCTHALEIPDGCGFGAACPDCPLRRAALDTIETGESHYAVETTMAFAYQGEITEKVILIYTSPLEISGQRQALVVLQDITDRKHAENALRRRNRDLILLNQASRAFTSTLKLDEVLTTVLQTVRGALDVLDNSIWLIDTQTNELVCEYIANPEYQSIRGWRLPVGEGLAGWAAAHGESVLVADTRAEPRHFKGVDRDKGLENRSIIAVPLHDEGAVVGVLEVVDIAPQRFDENDLQVVQSVAATASIAMRNARLYEQTQEDAHTKAMLLDEVNHRVRNNLTAITSILDMELRNVHRERADFDAALRDMQNRIKSITMVHRLLSAAQWAPLELGELVERIVHAAVSGASPRGRFRVTVTAPEEPLLVISKRAVAFALIINELTTNSIKHAFRDRDTGNIWVEITVRNAQRRELRLEFRDDGAGWADEVLRGERENIGLRLIKLNVEHDLRGALELYNDDGAVAVITSRLVNDATKIASETLRSPRTLR